LRREEDLTQVFVAVSNDPVTRFTSQHFHCKALRAPNLGACEATMQDQSIDVRARLSGVARRS
jgi:hypothetical protein